MKQLLKLTCLTISFLSFSLVFPKKSQAIFCQPPIAGATWTITAPCVVYEDFNGPANQNITINSGVSLTVHNGKNLVWYPGKSITIPNGASIIINNGGSLKQRKLCVKDSGLAAGQAASGYPVAKTFTDLRNGPPGITIYLGTDTALADASGNCTSPYRLQDVMTSKDWVDVGGAGTAAAGARASTYPTFYNLGFTLGQSTLPAEAGIPVPAKVGAEGMLICTGPTACTLGDPGLGNTAVEGMVGVAKIPTTNLDVTGALSTTSDLRLGGIFTFTTNKNKLDAFNANDLAYTSNSGNPGIALANSAGTVLGYAYGDSSAIGFLTNGRAWSAYSSPNKNFTSVGATTVDSIIDAGLKIGDGSTGYLQIGSSGWSDANDSYFRPIGTRHFLITSTHGISYFYSPTTYFGDGSSANNVYFRNTNLSGNPGTGGVPWGITGAGAATFTQQQTLMGSNTVAVGLRGDAAGNFAYYSSINFKRKDTGNYYTVGYQTSTPLSVSTPAYVMNYNGGSSGLWQVYSNGNTRNNGSVMIMGGSTTGIYTQQWTNWSACNGAGGFLHDAWLRMIIAGANYCTYHAVAVGSFYANGAQRFDLAEVTPVDPSEDLVLGEIVTTDPTHSVRLHRSQDKYQSDIIGVVSNVWTASMTIGGDTGPEKLDSSPDRRPIALAGRVTTLVNLESGPIKTGDSITSSSTAGTGMKASNAGVVVSKAMEDFDGTKVNSVGVQEVVDKLRTELKEPGRWTDAEKASLEKTIGRLTSPLPKGTGRIISFINVHDYDPDTKIANLDDYKLKDDTLTNSKGNLITRLGAFSQTVVGKMVGSSIKTQQLLVNNIDLLKRLQDQKHQIDELSQQLNELQP